MAKLVFKVASDWEKVVKLREECEKLEAQLKKMDVNKSPAAARALETQYASAKQQMMGLVTEAAKAGAVMERDFKNGIYNASQTVNNLSANITSQRGVIRQLQNELTLLKEKYRETVKSGGDTTGMSEQIKLQTAKLREQKDVLFGLTQQQADARLSVKRLKDEYAAFKEEAGETVEVNERMSMSLGKWLGVIGGAVALKNLASEVVNIRGQFQQLEIAFSTMLKSKEKADKLMSELVDIAAKTPFDLQGVASSAKQMLAYGSSAENVGDELVMLGNVAAGVGSQLSEIAYLYGTLRTQGRAYAVDIRQFAGRGIPIYEELAKVLGVTKDEVSDLVTAGKVGFKEVEQAFKNMTSESGIYYNLMEEQSKSLTGQLSNLGDAWDTMLNEIGKDTQGIASAGISGLKGLIENYETIGKVLLGLIAVYGTYKTALIVTKVVQDTLTTRMQFAILVTKAQTIAQAALNKVMSLNPYAVVATAVIALAYGIYKLTTHQTDAEKAQAKYNETVEEYEKSLASEQLQLDRLFTKLRTAKEGTDEYNSAKQAIIDQYGSYLDGMSAEIRTLKDVEGAYRAVNKAIIDAAKARAMEKVTKDAADTYVEKEAEARERLRKALESKYGNQKDKEGNLLVDKYYQQLLGTLDGKMKINQDFLKKFDKVYVNTRGTAGNATTSTVNPLREALWEIQDAKKVYDDIVKQAEARFGAISTPDTTGAEDVKKEFSDIAKETSNAIAKVRTLKQELADLRSGKTKVEGKSVEATIEEKEKELSEANKSLERLTGKRQSDTGGSKSTDKEKEIAAQWQAIAEMQVRQASEYARMNEDIEYNAEQARINTMRDGAEKVRAQRELDNKKELDDIERQKQAYIQKVIQSQKEVFDAQEKLKKEQNSKYEPKVFDSSTVKVDTSVFDKIAADTKTRQENDRLNQQEADWDEAIMKFGTYQQKRLAIERKYDKEIAEAQNAGQEWIALEAKKAALQSLDEQYGKSTQAMADLFESAGEKSIGEIQKIIDKYELLIKFLSGTEQPDGTAVSTDELKVVGFTDADIAKMQRGEISIKDVTDAVKGLKGELAGKSPWQAFVSDIGKGIEKLKTAAGNSEKIGEGIMGIGNAVTAFAPAVGEFANSIASMFGAEDTNITEITNAIGGLGQTAAGIGQIMSGDIIGGAMAAVGGISQVVNAFNQIHDKKNEKQIQKLQDQIDALDKSYDKLGKSIEKAYSTDATKLIEQQNKLLEQQKILIQQQIREEQDKKKTDDERIKDWQQQIEEINELIEDNKEAAIDAIFGEDVQSAIDRFASAVTDMWASNVNGSQNARDAVKQMMQQMVTESIKSFIQTSNKMEEIRQKLRQFYSDNVLSGWEQQYIYNMADELQKEIDRQFGWAEDLFKEDTKEQQSASGRGFGTEMTHEDAGELSGRFTAVYESNLRIETATQQQTVAITELRGSISALTAQASSMCNIADETRTILVNSYLELQQIRENTGEIIKPIKQMQADIAEVKRNTGRL